jgi:hypothetical protein
MLIPHILAPSGRVKTGGHVWTAGPVPLSRTSMIPLVLLAWRMRKAQQNDGKETVNEQIHFADLHCVPQ